MIGYTKLFQSIITSSIWSEDDKTRIMWITMLALCNRDGVVEGALSGLAVMARMTKEEAVAALERLSGPDPESRSSDNEGRRIEKVEGGWKILNHGKYRAKMSLEERREYNRLKKQEYRTKERLANREIAAREIIRNRVDADQVMQG